MNIDTAYLCHSCGEIQEGAKTGRCSNCQSEEVRPLAWALRAEQWREWLERITGKRRTTA